MKRAKKKQRQHRRETGKDEQEDQEERRYPQGEMKISFLDGDSFRCPARRFLALPVSTHHAAGARMQRPGAAKRWRRAGRREEKRCAATAKTFSKNKSAWHHINAGGWRLLGSVCARAMRLFYGGLLAAVLARQRTCGAVMKEKAA